MTPEEHRRVRLLERLTSSHECAVEGCGGLLVVVWDGEENRLVLRCGKNKLHRGVRRVYRRPHTWSGGYESWADSNIFFPDGE